jgi:alanine racemase
MIEKVKTGHRKSLNKIVVDIDAIKRRYLSLCDRAKPSGIIPVVKNNSNGLGFEKMYDVFSSFGCEILAAAYPIEFAKVHDRAGRKLGWNWAISQGDILLKIEGIELCCKSVEQVKFCLDHNITIHLVFNIGMNRGGFRMKDIPLLKEILKETPVFVCAHCPHKDAEGIQLYFDDFLSLKSIAENELTVFGTHFGSSNFLRNKDDVMYPADHHAVMDFLRIGEYLLLPDPKDGYSPVQYLSTVLDVFTIAAGGQYGYGAGIVDKETEAALVSVGYYNFRNIRKVLIGSEKYDVLCLMHDTLLVDLNGHGKNVRTGDDVVFMCQELNDDNWDGSITQTYAINQDLLEYEYCFHD